MLSNSMSTQSMAQRDEKNSRERILETMARPLTLRLSLCKNKLNFSPNKQKKMNPCAQN